MNRRVFIQKGLGIPAAFAGLVGSRPGLHGRNAGAGEVLEIRSRNLKRIDDDLDEGYTFRLMERIPSRLQEGLSWRNLIPRNARVGIKVSCLPGKKLSSSVGLVKGLVRCLIRSGIPATEITVWERTQRELVRAGFTPERVGCRVLGSDRIPGGGYASRVTVHRSIGTCFSLLLERADVLINVPVLKDHDISGISAGMKNLFGAIHNPNKYHDNGCDPYIADLNSHPMIRDKMKLTIADASRVQYHNGPAYAPRYCEELSCLLVGRDPVALDTRGWKIVEGLREKYGLPDLQRAGRFPAYLQTAERLSLGTGPNNPITIKTMNG